MNNQPKFKKGDRVRDIKQAITGEIVKFSDFYKEWIILTTSGRKTTSNEKDLQLLPFPAPDMLAIPDDHVWPVEWRKIDHGRGLKATDIISDGKYSVQVATMSFDEIIKANYTHYLTQSDLLKLKFED